MSKCWQTPLHNYKPKKNPGPSRAELREQLAKAAQNTAEQNPPDAQSPQDTKESHNDR